MIPRDPRDMTCLELLREVVALRPRVAELQARVNVLTNQVAGTDEAIQRLTAERDAFRGARDRTRDVSFGRGEAIARVLGRHSEFKIYTECGHDTHGAGEPGVVEVEDIGWVCQDGYWYSICRECCCTEDGDQTEECATYHDHKNGPLCPTRRDIDGDPESEKTP